MSHALQDPMEKRGLKGIHDQFVQVHGQLDVTFATASSANDVPSMGGVLGIMARMCVDAKLADRLVEKGMIQKVTRLLEFDSAQAVALRALSVVILHNGYPHVGKAVVALHSTLSNLALRSGDIGAVEHMVTIMAHATRTVMKMDQLPDRSVVQSMALTETLHATLSILRRPQVSYPLFTHAVDLITTPAYHCSEECKSVASYLPFLASLTRSDNARTRALGVIAIIHLQHDAREQEIPEFRPQQLVDSFFQPIPIHLLDILAPSSDLSLDVYTILDTVDQYQQAMCEAELNFNPAILGRRLADMVQRNSLVVGENDIQLATGGTRTPRPPFASWLDALPLCAQVLRTSTASSDIACADILDIKFLDTRGRQDEAIALAKDAVSRNPTLAYAYLMIGLGPDVDEGLRAAKKGLKCPVVTPFIRSQLLLRAVTQGAQLGLRTLQNLEGPSSVKHGSKLLKSALRDAEMFINEAAPDNLWLLTVLNWHIFLTVLVYGPKLQRNLDELQGTRTKISTTIKVMEYVQYVVPHRQLSTARDTLLDSYSEGIREWGNQVKRFDELCLGLRAGDHVCPAERHFFNVGPQIRIYRCSWCNMPSVALKECARCHQVRYCDASCQRSHWAEHRAVCRGR
ncbi:hypothetical protein C8Q76DRAFT_624603 [Earliella scabrosa]|nr:hypothetical protein C8Q76DRAFT_624603 [Earliella scabrosa]